MKVKLEDPLEVFKKDKEEFQAQYKHRLKSYFKEMEESNAKFLKKQQELGEQYLDKVINSIRKYYQSHQQRAAHRAKAIEVNKKKSVATSAMGDGNGLA